MPDEFMSLEEVSEAIKVSKPTMYNYMCEEGHPKFPNAFKPTGGQWKFPKSDVDTFLHIKPISTDKSTQIADLSLDIELTKKQQELDAIKLHFPSVEDYRKAQNKLLEGIEQYNKDQAQLTADQAELKAGQDELSVKISETNIDIDTAHADLNKYIADAKQRLDSTLKEFDNGQKGILEQAAALLTTPPIKAAGSVTFPRCSDCVKQDDANRDMTFIIPRIKMTPCAECEQKRSRVFPSTICDLCPSVARLREVARLIIQALVASGVTPVFDEDGIYSISIEGDKARVLRASDRVKMIMKEHGFET